MNQRLRSMADAVAQTVARPEEAKIAPPEAPVHGSPVLIEDIGDLKLRRRIEGMRAEARATGRARILRAHLVDEGISLSLTVSYDEKGQPITITDLIELWFAFIEAFAKASILWPDSFPEPEQEEKVTDEHLLDAGLVEHAIPAPKSRARTRPTLPGCAWREEDGVPCDQLRVAGRNYCPHHENVVRGKLMGGRKPRSR